MPSCMACGAELEPREGVCTCDLESLGRALARRRRDAQREAGRRGAVRLARTVMIASVHASERGAERVEAEDLKAASAVVRAEVEA